jgi:regulator of protease activity HflC (stomatin/prohibitin superfamily)
MTLGYGAIIIAILIVVVIAKTATVVPQQSAFVIEHLGKYSRTLSAGFHILVPFMERIAYKHSLKEIAIDIAEQICITRDNVQVGVDAVLYMQVMDPHLASRFRSWRKPPCAAKSAKSSWTGPSRLAGRSTPTW